MMTTTYSKYLNQSLFPGQAPNKANGPWPSVPRILQQPFRQGRTAEAVEPLCKDHLNRLTDSLESDALMPMSVQNRMEGDQPSSSKVGSEPTDLSKGHSDSAKSARTMTARKKILRDLLSDLPYSSTVLMVGGRHCTDLKDLYDEGAVRPDLFFHLIDSSETTIHQAHELLFARKNRCRFQQTDVSRFWTSDKYSLIWSDDLFDSKSENMKPRLFERLAGFLSPMGHMAICTSILDASLTESQTIGLPMSTATKSRLRELISRPGLPDLEMDFTTDPTGQILLLRSTDSTSLEEE